jgi:hypothetical protein
MWLLARPIQAQAQSSTASLMLIDIEPSEQSEVDSKTVLKARLDYQLPQQEGWYFIIAVFESTTPNMTFDGSFPNSKYKRLKSPSGRITFKFPMKYIFNDKRLAVPVRVRFMLNVRSPGGVSRAVVYTRLYEFQRRPKS